MKNTLDNINQQFLKLKAELEQIQQNPSSISQERLMQMLDQVTDSLDNIDTTKIIDNAD